MSFDWVRGVSSSDRGGINSNPQGFAIGLIGGSTTQRNFVFSQLPAGTAVKVGNLITVTITNHGLSVGEYISLGSRNPEWVASIQQPTIVSANVFTVVADFPLQSRVVSSITNTTDTDNEVILQYMSRYDVHGGYVRQALMDRAIAGNYYVAQYIGQGGDNYPQILARMPDIIPMARKVNATGGVIIGNVGADGSSWLTGTPVSNAQQLIRQITDTNCRLILATEFRSVDTSSGTTTPTERAAREQVRMLLDREQRVNSNMRYLNLFDQYTTRTSLHGFAPAGYFVDAVHYTQKASKQIGAQLATLLKLWNPYTPRYMRSYVGDVWTANTPAPLGANIAQGFWTAAGTTAVAATGGSGAVSGTMDDSMALVRTGAVAITGSTSGSDRRATQLVCTSTGAATLDVTLIGPAATRIFQQLNAGSQYEIGIDYALTGLTAVQNIEVFVDTGTGTARLGAGASSESPIYASSPSTAIVTDNEDGALWFPTYVTCPTPLPANFRLVFRINFSGTGGATLQINDYVIRRIN
jgi:hypothetical protein